MCSKHSTLPIIFEKNDPKSSESTKYCEKCFNELLQNKDSLPKEDKEEQKSSQGAVHSVSQQKQLTIEEKKAKVQDLQIKL